MSRKRRPRGFSPAQLAARAAALPVVTFPDLPVSAHRDQIAQAIQDHQVVIVAGETGSGKTTQIPKICLQLGRGISATIGHTQPRRIAARSVAERIAEELGTTVGGEPGQVIGYQMRFTDQVGPTTLVKLMTDGILLNEIQVDPELTKYDTLIIDEAHERSLNIDFILGYLARLLPRRRDLKVIITSATIDSDRFAEHFSQFTEEPVPVIEVSGRTYPVEIRYRPLSEDRETPPASLAQPAFQQLVLEPADDDLAVLGYGLGEDLDLEQALEGAVDELLDEGPGDILVFLPGERDIREAQKSLEGFLSERVPAVAVDVIPLYARLSAAEQHRIFQPHTRRRVILATNIAETSLTVPGISYVIDAGLARISRFSNKTKVQRLPIERVSQASANQRAGRAGRLEYGVAIRLYSAADYAGRPQFTEPEITRTSLASVILQMASLGLGEVADFPFIDPPSSRAVRDGVQLLVELGALTDSGKLTGLGRKLARLPIDPRLGRMLLAGERNGCASDVLVIIAALSIQDVRERPLEAQTQADQSHARFEDPASDFVAYLNLWRYLNLQSRDLSGSAFRRMCRSEYLHYLRFREWRDVVQQLRQMCKEMRIKVEAVGIPSRQETARFADRAQAAREYGKSARAVDYSQLHRSLLVGLLSNVGTWDQARANYLGTRGTRFTIWPGSGLAKVRAPWVMGAELVETSRLFARTVAEIRVEWIEESARHLVTRSYSEPYWSRAKGAAMIKEKVTLYGLVLAADRSVLLSRLGDYRLGSQGPRAAAARPGTLAAVAQGLLAEAAEKGWSSQLLQSGPADAGVTASELAREMFIREALVHGKWRAGHLPFVRHNERVLKEASEMEQRSRQGGQLATEEQLCDFFADRIPADIVSAAKFEQWWKGQRHRDPHLLDLSWEDVVPGASKVAAADLPDTWRQGQLEFPLSYEFSPGSPTDGVTVSIPLTVLPQVQDTGFDWLVPGMLEQLCAGTIRALPKEKRRHLAPAPDLGTMIAARLHYGQETTLQQTAPETKDDPRSLDMSLQRLAAWGQQTGTVKASKDAQAAPTSREEKAARAPQKPAEPQVSKRFFPAFAQQVAQLRGVQLSDADEQHAERNLATHLRMHFRIVGPRNKTLGTGSSLVELQRRFTPQADRAIHQAVHQAVRQVTKQPKQEKKAAVDVSQWQKENLTDFPTHGLPSVVETTNAQGLTVRGYPALAAGDTVTMRLESNADKAGLETQAGVAQLLLEKLRLPVGRVTTRWSGREALLLAASPYPTTQALVEAASLAAARALTDRLAPRGVRTPEAFSKLVDQARDLFEEEVYQILLTVAKTLEASRLVEDALQTHAGESLKMVHRQVKRDWKRLLAPDFMAATPRDQLPHLPRYLQALALRLQKAARGPKDVETDQRKWQRIMQVEEAWQQAVNRAAGRPFSLPVRDRLEQVRWLLEEFRVSQFAEQLGTPEKVSAIRIMRRLEDT